MVVETELERTFLAKFLPENIFHCNFTELKDNYIPKEATHPIIRIRKRGDKMVITKKYRKDEDNASVMIEETIPLTLEEYSFLDRLEGKKFSKHRYVYEYNPGKYCEIDIYQESLKGLVLIDFEFDNLEEKENFLAPDFCLAEVTSEKSLAGGMLCGKSYNDLTDILEKFNYKKIE